MPMDKNNNSNPNSIFLPCELWKEKMSKGEDVEKSGIYKTFIPDEIKVFDGEDGLPRAKFTISTQARDRDADTISPKGWVLDNYRKNPVILFAHDSRSLPIGQSVEVNTSKDQLISVARFDTDIADFPLPRTVVALLKRGTLRAASVGFIPMEWQDADPSTVKDHQRQSLPLDFMKQELVEWSIVPVPSNPEALMQAKAAGVDITPVVNWAGEVLDMYGGASAKGLWVPRSILETVAKIGSPTIFKSPNGGWGLEPKEEAQTVGIETTTDEVTEVVEVKVETGAVVETEVEEKPLPNPKDALMAFDRMKQIDRKESVVQFIEQDGRAVDKSEIEIKDNDSTFWCVVLRDHECHSSVVFNLGSDMKRSAVVEFASTIVEERKDPLLEVCPACSVGVLENGSTVYEEFLRLHWREDVKEVPTENKDLNPTLVSDFGSGVGTMDVIEAIKTHLGPSLKKALSEITGRVVEDDS